MDSLSHIFSDALLIDIDFSKWNDSIDMYLIGPSEEGVLSNRLPVYLVSFKEVVNFSCSFNHHQAQKTDGIDNFQWRIHCFKNHKIDDLYTSTFWYFEDFPRVTVKYKYIKVSQVKAKNLDDLFPEWNKPFSGFIRTHTLEVGNEIRMELPLSEGKAGN